MAREWVVEGVILRRWTSGEADKRVSLLTPDCGKLYLRVRGTQKAGSRMGMLTEPLNRVQGRVIEGRHQRLLVQPHLLHTYLQIRADLERLSVALALTEMVDRWLAEGHPEPEVYALLLKALDALESGADAPTLLGWMIWRLLALLGYSPELSHCAVCGALAPEEGEWHLSGGTGLCPTCKPASEAALTLSAPQRKRLQTWMNQSEPPKEAEPCAQPLVRLALRYAESVLEAEPRWLSFWERLSTLRE